jgi:hypothetical protein
MERTENEIAKEVVDAAFKIHQRLGPGLLESVYEAILGLRIAKERIASIPAGRSAGRVGRIAVRRGISIRLVRRKQSNRVAEIAGTSHPSAQERLLTHIRLANKRLGLLIDFGADLIKDGIFRVVNGLEEPPISK